MGIIPALAGNTPHIASAPTGDVDHPRSRGEYPGIPLTPGYQAGSSPLSRGIPAAVMIRVDRTGIIPALAGNTGDATVAQ